MLSGGSRRSWSATSAASTVTVHVSAFAKSAPGSIANVVGPPVAVAAWPPLVPHTTLNHVPATFTGSENVTLMLASTATPDAPLAGTVAVTEGAASLGAGGATRTAPPEASWTRTYWPGPIDPASGVMNCAALPKVPVPLALAYWIDQPARLTVAAPRLKSSTKSFPSCAPVFPPP